MSRKTFAAIKDRPSNLRWCAQFPRLIVLFAILILPARAQIDTGANGMSDVWERQFNNGDLFDPQNLDHAPGADPDGDGWSNLKESIAGTDPFFGNPPEGMVATQITYLKEQEEAPTPEFPEGRLIDLTVISWETLPGKQYSLLFSPNLTASSWLAVSAPILGDGQPAAVSVTLTDAEGTAPDKLFWRASIDDLDSDGDGLTDYEEFALGLNPNSAQTFAGIFDFWVAQHFPTSTTSFDPNAVPFSNGLTYQEMHDLGMDPNQEVVIGPVNLAFGEELNAAGIVTSFRDPNPPASPAEAYDPYSSTYHSSDLYDQGSIPGWQSAIGDFIEVWDENKEPRHPNDPAPHPIPYVELQAHFGGKGIKQQFDMLPGTTTTFLLGYKGRYYWDEYDNAFALEVEGAETVIVDGSVVPPSDGVSRRLFMQDDDGQKYEDWDYASVTITADPQATTLVSITLTLIPEDTDESITYGGFVVIIPYGILADTNRDGVLNPVIDSRDKNEWSNERGAIYTVNFDRDETNPNNNIHLGMPMPDAINFGDNGKADFEHYQIVNVADKDDIAPFGIRAINGLPEDFKVFLRVDEEESMRAVHIFKKIEAGDEAIWGSHMMDPTANPPVLPPWVGNNPHQVAEANVFDLERDITLWTNPNHPDFEETRDDPENQDFFTFGLEGLVLRGMKMSGGMLKQITGDQADADKFSGEILLHLEIRDPQENVVGSDSIRLRVAPWISLSHQEDAEDLYIGDMGPYNDTTRNALRNGRYVGLHHTNMMEEVLHGDNQWLQDQVEIGYTQRPGGPKTHLVFRTPYASRHSAATWPMTDLLSPDMGVFQLGALIANGDPEGSHSGGDYGGNLETLPPTQDHPHGIIMMGDSVSTPMRSFIRAQDVQHVVTSFDAPAQWLSVGHIDEYSSFLSNRRILIASSRLGIEALENEIPVNERHLRVFFATDSEVIAGTVTQDTPAIDNRIIHTGRDHLDEEDGVLENIPGYGMGRVAWIRFYQGNAKGQVAKVRLDDQFVVILDEYGLEPGLQAWALWNAGPAIEDYELQIGDESLQAWDRLPETDDKWILVSDTKRWAEVLDANDDPIYYGMPAVITVHEVLGDQIFRNLNYLHIQTKLNQAESAIRATGGGSGATHFIPVPALYFGAYNQTTSEVIPRSAYAFNPGPTNLQPVAGNLYVHRQFGPVNASGEDIYENIIRNTVQEPVFFVDGWDAYHAWIGEIHCGTNVTRTIPDEWWKKLQLSEP